MEKEATAHIIAQASYVLITDKAGTPRKLIITSPQSASLPSAELIQEITIRDNEPGLTLAYAQGPNTERAVEEILQWIENRSGIRFSYTVAEPQTHLLIFLPGVHLTQGQPKEIAIRTVTPQEARILVIRQLDKTNIDSLKTTSMGVEGKPVLHPEVTTKPVAQQRAELAQRFVFEDVSKIPPGVNPKQLDFLRDAASVGAFEWVREHTADMIADYYTTETALADLAKQYGISVPAVRERITRGMSKMRRILYRDKPELAEDDTYPLEQIQKGKERIEVLKSEKSRKRVGEASRSTIKRPGADIFPAKKDLR